MPSDDDRRITVLAGNSLARALARWENEGGAIFSPAVDPNNGQVALSVREQRILECLGAAVIAQWDDLPTDVKKALFEHAVSCGDPPHSVDLREQLARFLHNHKNETFGPI